MSHVTTINLIGNANFKFHKVDMNGTVADETITLPTTVGNNGQVRIGLRLSDSSTFIVILQPASGDTVDNIPNNAASLNSAGEKLMMIADEVARTWWIVDRGNIN